MLNPSLLRSRRLVILLLPLLSLLLPSCRPFFVEFNSAERVESALRGGESESAFYSISSWESIKDEVLEIQHKDSSITYMVPLRMSVKSQTKAWITVHEFFARDWDIGECDQQELPAKTLYCTLYNSGANNPILAYRDEKVLKKLGIKRQNTTKPQNWSSWEVSFPADRPIPSEYTVLRRIHVPQLQEKLQGIYTPWPENYYSSGNLAVQTLSLGSFIVLDIPISVAATLVTSTGGSILMVGGTIYEWIAGDDDAS